MIPRLGQNLLLALVVIVDFFSCALLAQGIYGLVAYDRKQPWPERPLWIVGMAGLMNRNQGFLHTIFNEMVVTEAAA